MASKDFTVAIVGGGMCGLVCAYALAKAGVAVQVFEAAVRIPFDLTSLVVVVDELNLSAARVWRGRGWCWVR